MSPTGPDPGPPAPADPSQSAHQIAADVTDRMLETAGRPIRSASVFYTFYYLYRIEGVESVEYDFLEWRERLRTGFFWYGVYSVMGEFIHVLDRYAVDGADLEDWLPQGVSLRDSDADADNPVARHLHSQTFDRMSDDERDLLLATLEEHAHWSMYRYGEGRSGMIDLLIAFEQAAAVLTDPFSFLSMVRSFFACSPDTNTDGATARSEGLTGWYTGYNGPAWTAIAEHTLRFDEDPPTMWVDVSFGIEHNNSNWLNKIEFDIHEFDVAREVGDGNYVASWSLQNFLTSLLDANRAGNMDLVFETAIKYQDDLGFNLRRLLRQMNLYP